MKKKIVSFIIAGAVLGLGLSSVIFSPKKAVESQGYSTSDLPTTIDLNDTSASDIRSYYSSLNGLSTSERQGNNLLKNLKSILKNGQKYYAYDGTSEGKKIWQMYEIVDRDWSKSPASSISGYNSSTNVITGYSYGTSYSSPGTNPYLHALYVDRSVTNEMRAWKKDSSSTENNHGNNAEWYIDREHIWPKSQGFEAEGVGGARGDPMHLWPGDSDVNSIAHNNNFYGYVNTSSSFSVGKWSYAQNNYRGASLTLGSGDNVFEPQDADKGDIARAIFYMVARYNYLSGSDSDGIDTNNPNLALVQDNTVASSYTSSTSNTGKMGILTDLLAWHHADPVDQFEIHRNNLLFNNYTNNRNPFIDFPEWVDFIWGSATYNGRNYQSYSSTPTGYATPSSDTINGYNSGSQQTVSVTGVSLNKNSTTISVGNTESLVATIYPNNATNQGLSWTSSNTGIASVSNAGVVTGVSEGNATITVTTNDGSFTAECAVSIVAASATPAGDGELYSGSIVEGDYIIYYDGKALNNTISTNRFGYDAVSPANNVISSPTSNIIWHISPSGNYWTIYNESISKYAAANGTKNQAQLTDSVDDYALWSISGSSTYEFVNKYNSAQSINCNLRNNGTYGFACYATSTGGALSLYKIKESSSSDPVTFISASCSKEFYVGETISLTDITVKDNNNNVVNGFTFKNNNYCFTYNDAASGGTATPKTFSNSIVYDELSCSLTVNVSRANHINYDSSLIHTGSEFSSAGIVNSYTTNQTSIVDGITFSVDGYIYGSKLSLSSSKTSAPGKVLNTTPYPTGITSVAVSGASPNIQYSTDGFTWVNSASADTATTDYYYFKLYYENTTQSSYVNITEIEVFLKPETPINVANYIMYEDTTNQCASKFNTAKGYFESLTKAQRSTFMSSNDYVISNARTRLQAWARSLGKTIIVSNGDYVISNAQFNILNLKGTDGIDYPFIVMISILVAGTGCIVGFYFVKRRKEEK